MDIYSIKCGENVLLLGEGNFSFCVDFIKLNKNINLKERSSTEVIATCFESSDSLSENHRQNISLLKEMGVTVLSNIDATRLKDYPAINCKRFTHIIFNFPHVGGKMKIHLNRKLLADFFLSSRDILDENGRILLTLCDGQGGTLADKNKRRWDDTWKVVEMAAEANFALKSVIPFLHEFFPGYTNIGYRSLNKGFNVESALTHVFKIGKRFSNFIDGEIESVFQLDKVITSYGSEEVSKVYSKRVLQNPLKNKYSPQAYLYELIKNIKFFKDAKFCDMELLYGFSCCNPTLWSIISKCLSLCSNFTNEVYVFKALSLSKLSNNFMQQPVCCNIVCVGNESSTFARQAVSALLVLFDHSENILLKSQQGDDDLFYVDELNRIDILKISRFHTIENNLTVCTIYLDNLSMFLYNLSSWHALWADGTRVEINETRIKALTQCLFPCTYTFDLSFSARENYLEENFYNVLWHIAGHVIFNVALISTYQPPDSNKKNFCYRISYRSYEVPLSRKQVIDIQHNVIGGILKKCLNVILL